MLPSIGAAFRCRWIERAIDAARAVLCSLEQVNNLREIQALKRLNPHPNIVKLYEVI